MAVAATINVQINSNPLEENWSPSNASKYLTNQAETDRKQTISLLLMLIISKS